MAQKRVFTPLFRLHTDPESAHSFGFVMAWGVFAWLGVPSDRLSELFQTALGTYRLRPTGLTFNIPCVRWITMPVAAAVTG